MPTREEIKQRAREIFAARGIDPNVAERVIKQESGFNPAAKNVNAKERSYGLAQLNEKGGLGAVALKQGIDPKDPNQWERHLQFMADTVKQDGWRQWYGARDAGIGRWDGIGGAPSGGGGMLSAASPVQRTAAAPGPNSPLPAGPTPEQLRTMSGILADTPDPFKQLAETRAAQEKEQQAQQLAQAMAASTKPEPQPQPTPAAPPEQPVNYAALLMPHLRRGLLGGGYGGLLA